MWIVAGVLLGAVVLAALGGFHAGPHFHGVAAVLGVAAAAWLLFMGASGRSAPLLWVLLGTDVVMSAGLGFMAVSGLRTGTRTRQVADRYRVGRMEAAEGIAVTDLDPEGVVRVRGEDWSAVSVNGPMPAGTRVQVLRGGVRLEVWGERPEPGREPPAGPRPRPAASELSEPTRASRSSRASQTGRASKEGIT